MRVQNRWCAPVAFWKYVTGIIKVLRPSSEGILTFRLKNPSGARKHHIRETENGNHPGDGQLSWPVVSLILQPH